MTEKDKTGSSTPDPPAQKKGSEAESGAKAAPLGGESKAKATAEGTEKRESAKTRVVTKGRARWGLRLLFLVLVLLLVALLLWWKNCLPGKGSGGPKSRQETSGMSASAEAPRETKGTFCTLRVDAEGITVEGKPVASPEAAVKACGESKRAVLTVTGDAISGKVDQLERALGEAEITVQRRK